MENVTGSSFSRTTIADPGCHCMTPINPVVSVVKRMKVGDAEGYQTPPFNLESI